MTTPPERIVITIPTAQKRKTSSSLGGGTGPFKLNSLFNEYESFCSQHLHLRRGSIPMRHLNNKKKPDHFVSYRTHRGPLVARVDLLAGGNGPLMPSHHG
jgi:hypothetical protein